MLSRRHLRSKGLQALYAFYQSENPSIDAGKRELLHSIDKIYDLYLYQLLLVIEIFEYAQVRLEDAKQKLLPTSKDLNPNPHFISNSFAAKLGNNMLLRNMFKKYKISWTEDHDIVKKFYTAIKESELYHEASKTTANRFEADKEFLISAYKQHIACSEFLEQYYEEKCIYWSDDFELVNDMVIKMLSSCSENSNETHPVLKLYKDEKEDKEFIVDLFVKTIHYNDEYRKLIAEKTQNWEVDRIALLDILIMEMTLCELLNFPSIPVKVSLNEYIDISKQFSTPKSKTFVNGILDSICIDLKNQNKIVKNERGLLTEKV